MATDYDAPRTRPEDEGDDTDSLEALRSSKSGPEPEHDEANVGEDHELPGADLSGEELVVRVVPIQTDEFTCPSCFLVAHTSQRDPGSGRCRDCA